MAAYKEKIEKGLIRKLFAKPKAGIHKWMKRQMNKLIRRKPIEEDEIGIKTNRKPYKGWDFLSK
ncbi:MAG: hypothetical protein IKT40_06015 [Bacilli bacterium]|nr:hypothetical protein [Bacilli bacterium]